MKGGKKRIDIRVQSVDSALDNGRSCSFLEAKLSTVHHGAKIGETASAHVLTTVLETCRMSHDHHMTLT